MLFLFVFCKVCHHQLEDSLRCVVVCVTAVKTTRPVSRVPAGSYHDEGAVEVETLSAALGHHVPGATLTVLQHGPHKQQQAEAGVQTQEQQLPAVVVPVGSSQVTRSVTLLLIHIRRLQPVSSTEGWRKGERGTATTSERERERERERANKNMFSLINSTH